MQVPGMSQPSPARRPGPPSIAPPGCCPHPGPCPSGTVCRGVAGLCACWVTPSGLKPAGGMEERSRGITTRPWIFTACECGCSAKGHFHTNGFYMECLGESSMRTDLKTHLLHRTKGTVGGEFPAPTVTSTHLLHRTKGTVGGEFPAPTVTSTMGSRRCRRVSPSRWHKREGACCRGTGIAPQRDPFGHGQP